MLSDPPSSGKRLVRRKKETNVLLVVLAVVVVMGIIAVVALFPMSVRRVTQAARAARAEFSREINTGVGLPGARRKGSPFVVSIENSELAIRGLGTLISEDMVLTAAHNVAQLDTLARARDTLTHPSRVSVSIRQRLLVPLQVRQAKRIWVHKAYSSGVGSDKALDIAIIELEKPFERREFKDDDFWQVASLGNSSLQEAHGTATVAAAFSARSRTDAPTLLVGDGVMELAYSEIILCGDAREWIPNNNTFCFASRSSEPPRVCSGDTGGPVFTISSSGIASVIGVIVSPPRVCVETTPHLWGVSVSVLKLRNWIDAIMKRKGIFAASEVSAQGLVDHDSWTSGDPEGEVFCSKDATGTAFRVAAVTNNPDVWRARHCSSGRNVTMAKSKLQRCNKPCHLRRVMTIDRTLENLSEGTLEVVCSKKTKQAFRLTGRSVGFVLFRSSRREALPCSGGIPVWLPWNDIESCPSSTCLETPPVDFEANLTVMCDSLGNAFLETGQQQGWISTPSSIIPAYFQHQRQVIPCHGGIPHWMYQYAVRPCPTFESQRCRGPEATPRAVGNTLLSTNPTQQISFNMNDDQQDREQISAMDADLADI